MYVKTSGEKYDNPVEDFSKIQTQEVYLPKGTSWIDFWTGETLAGGQTVKKEVPIDIIPLYVRAGSILPLAPKVQYATEKKWDNLEIRIYTGSDGEFTLYEDENDNYNYEKGIYSTIQFTWNDAEKTLTIADRKGKFPGMLSSRKFRMVLVTPQKGTGAESSKAIDKTVSYNGKKLNIQL
jgi:alpha-D-xyloside xylohydrolase